MSPTIYILASLLALSPVSWTPTETQSGKSSYYGEGNWHGSVTANGETFDPYGQTCAHRKVEFGNIVMVVTKNLDVTWCRVNDRGPFDIKDGKPTVKMRSDYKRIIDVSKGVARDLNLVKEGVTKVDIYW